jgi:crotonobetainyl-CoA:carnitine CoA-transferase CaiB-like acyl-CoA transferase
VQARASLLPILRERLATRSAAELSATMEAAGLPYAPIRRPEDLLDDPHLLATGGLADITLADGERAGQTVKTTLFPVTLDGERLSVRIHPPRLGEHSRELLAGIGCDDAQIDDLCARGVVA